MDITKLIDQLENSIKQNIIDFQTVKLKDGRIATRIILDRLLTDSEKEIMQRNKNIIGIDCIAYYKYAPEIKHSYFYMV